ncbi:MAG: glycosyltransferase family 4 protein [Actinomycetota bacterium]|nr:glycosyltransferase family 4 protein [Actinomycetota bacterium]
MRLTYVLDSPTYGGAEAYLAHLLTHLSPRFHCEVVATRPVPRQLAEVARRRGRLTVIAPVGQRWRRAPALGRALDATRPDLVHVNLVDPRSNRILLAVAGAGGAPAVATVHMTGAVGSPASRLLLGRIYRRLQAVVVVSAEIQRLVATRLGVPARRMHLVGNGVEPRRQPAAPRPSGAPLRVGGLGRLTPQKGFDLLIEATARLVAAGERLEVTIAGEGRDHDRLVRAAAGLPVRLAGFCEDVPAYLAGLDVFCLPSRAEGLPLALLEAMMAGLPCLATTVGGIPSAVGDAAIVVPPDDVEALTVALRRLLHDARLRSVLSRRAHALARRRFDVSTMVAGTAAVYDQVLSSAGMGSRVRTQESGYRAQESGYPP